MRYLSVLLLLACTSVDDKPPEDTADTDLPDVDTDVEDTVDTDPPVLDTDIDPVDTDVEDTDVEEPRDPNADDDGDGTINADDCGPDDPTIFPGAVDVCDGVDSDCGGDGDPDGTAWWQPTIGDGMDMSEVLAGTASDPARHALPGDGILRLCAGTWHVQFVAEGVTSTVVGMAIDRVAVQTTGRAFEASDGAALTLQNLAISGSDLPGAAIHLDDSASVTVRNSLVHDVTEHASVLLTETSGPLLVEDSEFLDVDLMVLVEAGASATFNDVGVDSAHQIAQISGGAIFRGFTANGVHGGIVVDSNGTLAVRRSVFKSSGDATYAEGSTVMVHADGALSVEFDDVLFEELHGQAFRLSAATSELTEVTVSECVNEPPSADVPGVAVLDLGIHTLLDIEFVDNTTNSHGGGLFLGADSIVNCTNCTFTGNSATGDGGAIAYVEAPSQLSLSASTFTGNTATGRGGAVFAPSRVLSLANTTFEGNTGSVGGAVYVGATTGSAAIVRISNGTFLDNEATVGHGGALYADWVGVDLTRGSFTGNTAAGSGGAVRTVRELSVDAVTFTGNESGGNGGAISTDSPSVLDIDDSVFWSNTAVRGGALSHVGGLRLTDVDLGAGSTDNTPDDILTGGTESDSYPGVQTLQCTTSMCP